jgi:hypothetical protein
MSFRIPIQPRPQAFGNAEFESSKLLTAPRRAVWFRLADFYYRACWKNTQAFCSGSETENQAARDPGRSMRFEK